MDNTGIVELVYYILGIIGVLGGGIFGISRITISLKKYVEETVDEVKEELNEKINEVKASQTSGFNRVDEKFNQNIHSDEVAMLDLRNEVSQLKAQVAAHTARFGIMENLLTEMRSDIKLLLARRD